MIELRPYQSDLVGEVRKQFKSGKRNVIMCLPTGAGKTVVFSSMVAQTLQKDVFARVLIITDREELLRQAGGTLQNFNMEPEFITANNKYVNKHARLFVGMVETLERRKEKLDWLFDALTLVIIDEAHRGNFRKMMPLFERAYVIGATATPISASKKHPLKDHYQGIVVGPQIPELIEEGYLCSARTFSVEDDLNDLVVSSTGDYTDASLNAHFNKHERRLGVVTEYRKHAHGTKALVFCVGVDHANETAAEFRACGYDARSLDGKTDPFVRKQTLLWFKETPGAILCNCGVLTTGFDEPSIQTVIINRATKSLPLWLQMCGRGSRCHPGKDFFYILDMGANVVAGGHGLWEQERDWEAVFTGVRKKESNHKEPPPFKICPKCKAMVSASTKVCPNCQNKFPQKEKMLKSADLVEISTPFGQVPPHLRKPKSEMSVLELIERARIGSGKLGRPYKKGWIVHELRKRGERALLEYARIMGYSEGWVRMQMLLPTRD